MDLNRMRQLAGIVSAREGLAESMVGKTILQQMGGPGRLAAMIGAKDFITSDDGVSFKWPAKQRSKGNGVRITLRPDDTYDMEFLNAAGSSAKSVKKYEGLYNDQLVHVFEKQTGLYLSFGKSHTPEGSGTKPGLQMPPIGTKHESRSDNIKKAAEYGSAAFHAGVKAAPSLDRQMMGMLKGMKVGSDASLLMKSWMKAWHQASLTNPVESKLSELKAMLDTRQSEGVQGYKLPFYARTKTSDGEQWFYATGHLKNGGFSGKMLDAGAAGRPSGKAKKSSLDARWAKEKWNEVEADEVPPKIKSALGESAEDCGCDSTPMEDLVASLRDSLGEDGGAGGAGGAGAGGAGAGAASAGASAGAGAAPGAPPASCGACGAPQPMTFSRGIGGIPLWTCAHCGHKHKHKKKHHEDIDEAAKTGDTSQRKDGKYKKQADGSWEKEKGGGSRGDNPEVDHMMKAGELLNKHKPGEYHKMSADDEKQIVHHLSKVHPDTLGSDHHDLQQHVKDGKGDSDDHHMLKLYKAAIDKQGKGESTADRMRALLDLGEAGKTYKQSHDEIMTGLAQHGWDVKKDLKVPHATSPTGAHKLYFKKQAVHLTHGKGDLGSARSIWSPDTRGSDLDSFAQHLGKWTGKDLKDNPLPKTKAPEHQLNPDQYHQKHGECPEGYHFDGGSKKCVKSEATAEKHMCPECMESMRYDDDHDGWLCDECGYMGPTSAAMKGVKETLRLAGVDRYFDRKLEKAELSSGMEDLVAHMKQYVDGTHPEWTLGEKRTKKKEAYVSPLTNTDEKYDSGADTWSPDDDKADRSPHHRLAKSAHKPAVAGAPGDKNAALLKALHCPPGKEPRVVYGKPSCVAPTK